AKLPLAQLRQLIAELARRFAAHPLGSHLANRPFHECGGHRRLRACEPERLASRHLVHTLHLEQHLAGLHAGYVVLDVALAAAHADLERLLADRDVRKHADPDLSAAFHVARHGTARRLDLARGHARAAGRLQAELAEGHVAAALCQARVAALELLAILGAFGLQHCSQAIRSDRAATSGAGGVTGGGAAGASGVLGAAAASASPACSASSLLSNTSPLNIHTLTPMTP